MHWAHWNLSIHHPPEVVSIPSPFPEAAVDLEYNGLVIIWV